MTTRDDLHRLVDELPPEGLEALAELLLRLHTSTEDLQVLTALLSRSALPVQQALLPVLVEPPYPRSVGSLTGAPADLSANLDDYLADGFGQ
ncbi:hypothetical protein [Streptomyces sp. NPDC057280]|uniref:hypothetical protein n=1 Tax=Streptomyces sp. NPDC057280 TaxID=3346081 RepID=UPI0036306F53